jgi:hypothetical protein
VRKIGLCAVYLLAGAGVAGAVVAGAGVAGAGVAGAVVAGAVVAGAGVAGGLAGVVVAGVDGCVSGARPPITEEGPLLPMIPSASAPTMNRIAQIVVARDSTVAPLRAPNADWLLPPPPNALAMSPPLPCWRYTTSIIVKQANM